ncbi:MAG: hypothetical protein AAFQ43_13660, partial [Bacteroidota bacterium]
LEWTPGHYYRGQWRQGIRNGHGVMNWTSGHHYEGNWVDGKRAGQGQQYYPEEGFVFTGTWVDDKPTVGRYGPPNTPGRPVRFDRDRFLYQD